MGIGGAESSGFGAAGPFSHREDSDGGVGSEALSGARVSKLFASGLLPRIIATNCTYHRIFFNTF